MRIDHFAYQRATRVAGFGFFVQLLIGLTLLIFGLVADDTVSIYGSLWGLLGVFVWLGLIVIFNQHKLERLEALESDELAARTSAESVFEPEDSELRVAARRLRLMHKWFIPILSLVVAATLGLMGWLLLRHLAVIADGEAAFQRTTANGWAVAICLAYAAMSFIVSRFVAGMAKQPAWANLRGGAAWMVGNSLVLLAISVGIGFRFFKNEEVITWIAYAIPIFMILVAVEIVLNFVLNLYRPRIPGDTPRPAFDSKLLSLFSAPDNLVRSINEAVNYQFGFDVTSSWGYQLLIRSVAWLVIVGVGVMVLLNTLVIVEPHQQAVKLSRGALAEAAHGSGVMLKGPWPFQTAETYDVSTIRSLHLTSKQVRPAEVQLWTDDLGRKFDKELTPFMVARSQRSMAEAADTDAVDEAEALSQFVSLVDAEIVVRYRIKEENGLLDFLGYSGESQSRRSDLSIREAALRHLALREVTQVFSSYTLDGVLAGNREQLPARVKDRIQSAFDSHDTGIEVVTVDFLMMRPAGTTAAAFEELSISHQAREQFIASARQMVGTGLTQLVGDYDKVDDVLAALDEYNRLRDERGLDDPVANTQRQVVERLLVASEGEAATIITGAEGDRWVQIMDTRAEANRLIGQLVSYEAAPRLYREREKMIVYGNNIPGLHKYILCVDPDRVQFDIDLKELNAMLNFADALENPGEGGTP